MSAGRRDALRGYSKKIRLGIFGSLDAHRYFSFGNVPCWVYSNEDASGLFKCLVKNESIINVQLRKAFARSALHRYTRR